MNQRTINFTRSTVLLFAAALPLRGAETAPTPDSVTPTPPPVSPVVATLPKESGGDAELPPDASLLPVVPAQDASRKFSINLLKRLVERGALTQKDAEELVILAEADTAAASAPPPTPAPAPLPGEVRVTYIPETVRNRIRDEIKEQLKQEAREESWFAGQGPDWVSRVEPFADIRIRYEIDTFPLGNDNTGAFPNFNAINTGDPFDTSGTLFSPQYNVDQERQRARIRFRAGAELNLEEDFTLGFRLGTGQDNSPVSSNQTLGYAGGRQGGNFSKFAIWLDRAFLAYEPNEFIKLSLGRFDNPFFSTTTMWSEDIGFDGAALQLRAKICDEIQPYFTGGIFPVFNTELNFSSNQPAKFESIDKWLYAAQAGFDLKLGKDLRMKLGAAYYHFENIEGQLSTPYTPLSKDDAGDTDGSRPAFAQKGNTYRPIRNIVPSIINNFGTSNQFQYFGLATPFKVATATGRIDYDAWGPIQVSLLGEYARNVAFDREAINAIAVNNRGANGTDGTLGLFDGEDTAWYVNLKVGHAALEKRGQWNAFAGYRWVGSDAVVDGFNDQDFGGGGTNMKGFTVGGNIALSKRVRFGIKWLSADQIAGPPLKSDIIMFDFGAKF